MRLNKKVKKVGCRETALSVTEEDTCLEPARTGASPELSLASSLRTHPAGGVVLDAEPWLDKPCSQEGNKWDGYEGRKARRKGVSRKGARAGVGAGVPAGARRPQVGAGSGCAAGSRNCPQGVGFPLHALTEAPTGQARVSAIEGGVEFKDL